MKGKDWRETGAVDFGFITPPAVTDLETITIKEREMLAVGYKDKHSLSVASRHFIEYFTKNTDRLP